MPNKPFKNLVFTNLLILSLTLPLHKEKILILQNIKRNNSCNYEEEPTCLEYYGRENETIVKRRGGIKRTIEVVMDERWCPRDDLYVVAHGLPAWNGFVRAGDDRIARPTAGPTSILNISATTSTLLRPTMLLCANWWEEAHAHSISAAFISSTMMALYLSSSYMDTILLLLFLCFEALLLFKL